MAEKKKAQGAAHSEPSSRRTTGWTPAKLKLAEQQADGGNLRLAADACETMFRDDRYSAVLKTLGNVVSLPLSFETGRDGGDPENDPACLALGGQRGDYWAMLPESVLHDVIRWTSTLGVALGHVREWVPNDETGRLVADVEVWSPRWLEEKDGRLLVETSKGKIEIQPGDSEWILWSMYSKSRPWRYAPWTGLLTWWLAKAFGRLDEMDFSDRQGDAKLVAEQIGVDLDIVGDDGRRQIVRDIRSLGRNGVYAAPPNVSLKLLESSGKKAEVSRLLIEQANSAFAVTILGGNLSAEVTGGSFAAASVHAQVTHDRIRDVASMLSTESHYQLLVPWHERNFGGRAAPWAVYDTSPPADKQARANQFSTTANAVVALLGAGIPADILDVNRLATEYDLPIDLSKVGEWGIAVGMPDEVPPRKPEARGLGRVLAKARSRVEQRALVDLVAARSGDDALADSEEYLERIERSDAKALLETKRPAVEALVELVKTCGVEGAASDDERRHLLKQLRSKVVDMYGDLDPELYAETQERVMILAAMNGLWSAAAEV